MSDANEAAILDQEAYARAMSEIGEPMKSSILERLRAGICDDTCRVKNAASGCACAEAADRIAQLEAALRPFAEAANGFDAQRINNPEEWFAYGGVRGNHETTGAITVGDLRRARAAWEDRT
jgi:hypothetical protein